MKKNLSTYLLSLFALTAVVEAKEIKHERNKEVFIGGEGIHFQTKKQEIIPQSTINFEKESKAACTKLPLYIESSGNILLATEGKTPNKIQEDRKQFYNIVFNLTVLKGGDYGFVKSGFDFKKPEQEYLLSHKIDALKLLLNASVDDLSNDNRAKAAYLMAALSEKHNLASSTEIFNYYHQVLRAVSQTELGKRAWEAQVRLLGQINQKDLSLATYTLLVNNSSHLLPAQKAALINHHKQQLMAATSQYKNYPRDKTRAEVLRRVGIAY